VVPLLRLGPSASPSPAASAPPVPTTLDRRRFLTLGSAGLAALSLGGLTRSAAAAELGAMPLSVGYLVGSDGLPGFDELTWRPQLGGADPEGGPRGRWISPYSWRVEPADRLPIGDQSLAGSTIEVRLHGLYPKALEASWFASADLDVLFPAPLELPSDAEVPYFAWSLSRRSVPAPSPPCCFPLPLGPSGGLDLRLRVVPGSGLADRGRRPAGAAAAPWSFATRFTVDWDRGMPRLCRGVYFLALAPGTWKAPVRLPAPGEPERPDLCSLVMSVERVEEEDDRV
jgi:hypothetical protein